MSTEDYYRVLLGFAEKSANEVGRIDPNKQPERAIARLKSAAASREIRGGKVVYWSEGSRPKVSGHGGAFFSRRGV